MKITRTSNYILLEEIGEHYQGYDEVSFILEKGDRTPVSFLLEIVSSTSVRLIFAEKQEDKIIIFSNIKSSNQESIDSSILVSELEVEKKEVIDNPINIEVEFIENEIEFPFLEEGDNPKDTRVILKVYEIEQYNDYPSSKERLVFESEEGKITNNIIEYDFQKDKIYELEITHKKNKKIIPYIHDMPEIYYSSVYHLKEASSEVGLLIDDKKENTFDLKLLIWRFSKLAFAIAGISDKEIKRSAMRSVITEYVTSKVLVQLITKAITDINLTPGLAENSLGKIQIKLGDFEQGKGIETITTQLLKAHKMLADKVNQLERDLPEIFKYLQTGTNPSNKNYKGIKVERKKDFKGSKK